MTPPITIEKGIPVPPPIPKNYRETLDLTLDAMEVGDSFTQPRHKQSAVCSQIKASRKSFTTRKIDENTIRVWRIACNEDNGVRAASQAASVNS